MALTNAQKQKFEEDGYIIVPNLLNHDEVEAVRQRADLIASGGVTPEPGWGIQVEPSIQRGEEAAKSRVESIRKLGGLVRTDPVMNAHATNPKIMDIIADLLGPDIKLLGDQLFMKSSMHGSRKNYHQDSQSWQHVAPDNLVSCWAALDDATVENGCLWFIPGSHKWGLIGVEREREVEQEALSGPLENEVPIELKAGDCSFHHSLVLHSSRANRSSQRRRGYATHYMSARTRYVGEGDKPDYLLIRGEEFPGCV